MDKNELLALIAKMRKDLAEVAGYVAAGEWGDAGELASDFMDDADKFGGEFLCS